MKNPELHKHRCPSCGKLWRCPDKGNCKQPFSAECCKCWSIRTNFLSAAGWNRIRTEKNRNNQRRTQ